jgi:hypothetical protein
METVKKISLIGFVTVCVLLIVLIWAQGLNSAGISGVIDQPTQAANDFLTPTKTPTPYNNPAGTNIPNQQLRDQTETPNARQTQPFIPSPTPNLTQTWVAQGYEE